MEFLYDSPWKISNKEVEKTDNLRADLNKNLSMLLVQSWGDPLVYLSLETIENIKDCNDKLSSDVKQLKKQNLSLFDNLVLKDIQRNTEISTTLYNYFYNHKSKNNIGKFLSGVFGNSAFTNLLASVHKTKFPHKDLHTYSELMHKFNSRTVDHSVIFQDQSNPLFVKIKEGLSEKLKKSKTFVNNFYKEYGISLKNSDYHFEFAPPGFGFSFWDSPNLMAAIDPQRILCYKSNDGNYNFFKEFIDLIGTHELSHGIHDELSKKTMPLGLRTSPEDFFYLVHGPINEGSALSVEDFTLDFMKKNMEKLKISEADFKRADYFTRCYIPKKLPQIVHDVCEVMEIEQTANESYPEGLRTEAHNHLAKLTGIKRYSADYFFFNDNAIEETLFQSIYFFGKKMTDRLVKKMKDKNIEDKVMIHALHTGFWCSPEAQEKFIFDLYLPKVLGA